MSTLRANPNPEVNGWCPTCEEYSVRGRSDQCMFCDTPLDVSDGEGGGVAEPLKPLADALYDAAGLDEDDEHRRDPGELETPAPGVDRATLEQLDRLGAAAPPTADPEPVEPEPEPVEEPEPEPPPEPEPVDAAAVALARPFAGETAAWLEQLRERQRELQPLVAELFEVNDAIAVLAPLVDGLAEDARRRSA